jgi:hypothetical protein
MDGAWRQWDAGSITAGEFARRTGIRISGNPADRIGDVARRRRARVQSINAGYERAADGHVHRTAGVCGGCPA